MDDHQVLEKLNAEIADREEAGDREWFDGILAPRLAFMRADPGRTMDDRVAFLQKVRPEDPPKGRRTAPGSVEVTLFGGSRAVVACVVTMTVGGRTERYHNLRLFVKLGGQWKLLGWANEVWQDPSPGR